VCCTGRKAHKCSPWRLPGGVWLRLRATSLYSTNGWQQEAAVTHMQCSTELGARKRPSRATKSGCFQWSSSAIAVSAPRQRPRQAQAKGPLGCRRVRCGVTLQVEPHQRDVRDALRAIPARDAAPAAHTGPAPCAQVIRGRGLVQVRQAAAPLLQDGCVVARAVDGHPERAGLLGRSCWRSRADCQLKQLELQRVSPEGCCLGGLQALLPTHPSSSATRCRSAASGSYLCLRNR